MFKVPNMQEIHIWIFNVRKKIPQVKLGPQDKLPRFLCKQEVQVLDLIVDFKFRGRTSTDIFDRSKLYSRLNFFRSAQFSISHIDLF